MADKFKAGDKVTAKWQPPIENEPRHIDAVVIDQESPGMYRVQTNMGITMLLPEDDLG